MFIFVSVSIMVQSEPLYVPVKFHDLPSEKPENTSIDTEKSKQYLEFPSFRMGGNHHFLHTIPKLSDFLDHLTVLLFHKVLACL